MEMMRGAEETPSIQILTTLKSGMCKHDIRINAMQWFTYAGEEFPFAEAQRTLH